MAQEMVYIVSIPTAQTESVLDTFAEHGITPVNQTPSLDNSTLACVFVVSSDIDMATYCQNLVLHGYATLYSCMLAKSWASDNADARARLLSCFDATHQML